MWGCDSSGMDSTGPFNPQHISSLSSRHKCCPHASSPQSQQAKPFAATTHWQQQQVRRNGALKTRTDPRTTPVTVKTTRHPTDTVLFGHRRAIGQPAYASRWSKSVVKSGQALPMAYEAACLGYWLSSIAERESCQAHTQCTLSQTLLSPALTCCQRTPSNAPCP